MKPEEDYVDIIVQKMKEEDQDTLNIGGYIVIITCNISRI